MSPTLFKQSFKVLPEEELRVECELGRRFKIKITNGSCELFGSEIASGAEKELFGGGKFAFFSFDGCDCEVVSSSEKMSNKGRSENNDADVVDEDGEYSNEEDEDDENPVEIAYVASETPMLSYLNVHGVLEAKRAQARDSLETIEEEEEEDDDEDDDDQVNDNKEKNGRSSKRKRNNNKKGEDNKDGDNNDDVDDSNNAYTVKQDKSEGPRVMIVGPSDVGKSSLSKILINYASRAGWSPLFVDLDLGQNAISLPGTIAAAPIEHPLDPFAEGGFVNSEMPLAYYFGDVTVNQNSEEHYKFQVEKIADMLDARNEKNKHARNSGVIVNTMGWIDGLGFDLLLHARKALNIDVVICLGQERLFQSLSKVMEKENQRMKTSQSSSKKMISSQQQQPHSLKEIEIISLKKSGGVVERTTEFRRHTRDDRFREYFYGFDNSLSPTSQTAYFSSVSFYRVGGGPKAPTSALPIGQEASTDSMKVTSVIPSNTLLNSVCAVSHGKTQSDLLTSNVAGFIHIVEVDMIQKKFTYLSPSGGQLPNTNLIVGNVKWFTD